MDEGQDECLLPGHCLSYWFDEIFAGASRECLVSNTYHESEYIPCLYDVPRTYYSIFVFMSGKTCHCPVQCLLVIKTMICFGDKSARFHNLRLGYGDEFRNTSPRKGIKCLTPSPRRLWQTATTCPIAKPGFNVVLQLIRDELNLTLGIFKDNLQFTQGQRGIVGPFRDVF
jgi:hypothetical protein